MKNYISELEKRFRSNANTEYAVRMKKYMRDQFEYLGISAPIRREITKDLLQKSNLPPISEAEDLSTFFWKKQEREYQYFALELLSKYIKQFDEDFTDYLEYLITNKSWWDTVDSIASNLVGAHLQNHFNIIKPVSEKWCNSDNMWLQRTSLIFQLKYKSKTDTDILFEYINRHSSSSEFFIRKAIGWALREYSKTDPEAVVDFVKSTQLSNLSRKEALKRIK